MQTVAERVVDRVDEALKPDIMHWAAIYVSIYSYHIVISLADVMLTIGLSIAGSPNAPG